MKSDCHVDNSVSIHRFVLFVISHGSNCVDHTVNILNEIIECVVVEAVTFMEFNLWELVDKFWTSYLS